jgi:hypothetical protein
MANSVIWQAAEKLCGSPSTALRTNGRVLIGFSVLLSLTKHEDLEAF